MLIGFAVSLQRVRSSASVSPVFYGRPRGPLAIPCPGFGPQGIASARTRLAWSPKPGHRSGPLGQTFWAAGCVNCMPKPKEMMAFEIGYGNGALTKRFASDCAARAANVLNQSSSRAGLIALPSGLPLALGFRLTLPVSLVSVGSVGLWAALPKRWFATEQGGGARSFAPSEVSWLPGSQGSIAESPIAPIG